MAAEIYPLCKTGGLADVVSALPKALSQLNSDVRLLMPAYPSALDGVIAPEVVADLGDHFGNSLRLISGRMPDSGLPVFLLENKKLFDRRGSPYTDDQGHDWPDNAERFGSLCSAAVSVALGKCDLSWVPDVVHCHDWHTGLVPLLLHFSAEPRPRTIFTIHNAAFAGKFSFDAVRPLNLPDAALGIDGAEFYGDFSFLKAGIRYADKLTTVSPTYAREICTPEFGGGLDGLLRARSSSLVGIMNGIDSDVWDPARDPYLSQQYSTADCGGKDACKADLQRELGLDHDPSAPLAIFVSRVTPQKMADVLLNELPTIMQLKPQMQFALLGSGDRQLERAFVQQAGHFPGRMAVSTHYTERLAHRLHAGGDILLHGSRFEPCGLAQLYAMRYGTLPLVRRVGGLADSVRDADSHRDSATGFVFDEASGVAFASGVMRCVNAYRGDTRRWRRLQKNAMSADFSWRRSAEAYAKLYQDSSAA